MLIKSNESTILSFQIGKPEWIAHGKKKVLSGIWKQPSQEAHFVSKLGISGDGQADTVHHGGVDKAICAYFQVHYPFWEETYGQPFQHGSFGENVTLSNWNEHDLCIGDLITGNEVVLQVSQPRRPCFKLGIRNQLQELPAAVEELGFTGFYFRVIEEGNLQFGETLRISKRHPSKQSLAQANQVMYKDKSNRDALQELLAVEELSASWRERLLVRLQNG